MCITYPPSIYLPMFILGILVTAILGYSRPDLVYTVLRWLSNKKNAICFFAIVAIFNILAGLLRLLIC